MTVLVRRRLVLLLTMVFLAQSWLVYSDPAGRRTPPLTPLAVRGRALWHRHNCQSCHQLYGFGGFLGPDLTNLAGRVAVGAVEREGALARRLDTVLTTGSQQMPAFGLPPEERSALEAFLTAVDATGVGQVVVPGVEPPRELFARLMDEAFLAAPPAPLVETGRRIVAESGCIDCHLPNGRSAFGAVDLTRASESVAAARLAQVLSEGVPEKGMPALGLDAESRAAVAAFLEYLGRDGADVRATFTHVERGADGSLLGLPWFEYR